MVSPATSLPLSNVDIPEPEQVRGGCCGTNVGEIERVVSILGGSMMVVGGVRRLSLPGLLMAGLGGALIHRGSTGQCGLYKALGVTTVAEQAGVRHVLSNPLNQRIRVERSVTVGKPVAEVYAFWRSLENLPRFMDHLESVTVVDTHRSTWRAKAPRGRTVEWNADIVEEEINRKIAWKSVEGADIPNAGQVLFEEAPGGGTTVHVVLAYDPPAGIFGALVAKLFGEEPTSTVKEDLRRFKQIMEAGEAPTVEGQPRGTCK